MSVFYLYISKKPGTLDYQFHLQEKSDSKNITKDLGRLTLNNKLYTEHEGDVMAQSHAKRLKKFLDKQQILPPAPNNATYAGAREITNDIIKRITR